MSSGKACSVYPNLGLVYPNMGLAYTNMGLTWALCTQHGPSHNTVRGTKACANLQPGTAKALSHRHVD